MHQRKWKCNCTVCSYMAVLLHASTSCAFLDYLTFNVDVCSHCIAIGGPGSWNGPINSDWSPKDIFAHPSEGTVWGAGTRTKTKDGRKNWTISVRPQTMGLSQKRRAINFEKTKLTQVLANSAAKACFAELAQIQSHIHRVYSLNWMWSN